MIVRVTARGDPDAIPLIKTFRYESRTDEVFLASVRHVAGLLEKGVRININQVMLLFVARVVESLGGGRRRGEAAEDLRGMVAADQVMIGVPEMVRVLEFEVAMGGGDTVRLTARTPIVIPDYALG